MPKNGYKHVTRDQRSQIYALKSRGISIRQIANQLGVSPSTISREIKRNSGQRGYRYEQADRLAQERRSAVSRKPKKLTEKVKKIVEHKLHLGWSPEQISGRLKKEGIVEISHESIYQMVWADKKQGGNLYNFLRRKAKPYNRRKNKRAGRGCIPNRVDIDQRPKIVEEKSRIGDWEGDTIIGANHQGAIVSIVERMSKFTILEKVENKTSKLVSEAINSRLSEFADKVNTLTFDNGKEFADHVKISEALGANCYFAKPYHSWERGLNEHTNGLVRERIPKKTDFREVTHEQVRQIEKELNARPRKILNYKTPYEVFHQKDAALV